MKTGLTKAGANWVDGDRFFNREPELEALRERVRDGNHTLLTAQRRMGKTSLVRELLRRLDEEGRYETIFVDLEAANSAADAVTEIAVQSRSVHSAWQRIPAIFGNIFQGISRNVEEIGLSELKIKLRAAVDSGNWRDRGDAVFETLAASDKPIVLAIDELPILVNRILKGQDYSITPHRREEADNFLSWLRRNGQNHRGNPCMIVSGSIGLEPVLREAGLSAHANIFASFQLEPWSQDTAIDCLGALAQNYGLQLPRDVRIAMCRRLRCCVPHHVQQFFSHLHEHLRREYRSKAILSDVEDVYRHDLLGVRGQIDLEHYEGRLKMAFGPEGYLIALDLLTEASVKDGSITDQAVAAYRNDSLSSYGWETDLVQNVLYTLEHDGYLERRTAGYRFMSGLLEDWWRVRHGTYFTPILER